MSRPRIKDLRLDFLNIEIKTVCLGCCCANKGCDESLENKQSKKECNKRVSIEDALAKLDRNYFLHTMCPR
jgi:hypothetical protein